MSRTKEQRYLLACSRAIIAILMIIGFYIDGCGRSEVFFTIATLMWIYQPFVVRTESNILHGLRRVASISTK